MPDLANLEQLVDPVFLRRIEDLHSEPICIYELDEIPTSEISDDSVLPAFPLASVAMITYNHAPYIGKAIEGVLMQKTSFPIELVIGEDCSTDGTCDIVLDYHRRYPSYIRVICSRNNVGMKKNCCRTINAARGKYLAFCEGDDYWKDPFKLQKQVDYLEKHTDCGLIHTDADFLEVETGNVTPAAHASFGHLHNNNCENVFLEILQSRYLIWTLTVCARKALVDRIVAENAFEFRSNAFLMGDTQLWMELARISRIHYMGQVTAVRNILPESATRSRDPFRVYCFRRSGFLLLLYYCRKYLNPAGKFYKATCSNLYVHLLKLAFIARDVQYIKRIHMDMKAEKVCITKHMRICILLGCNKILIAGALLFLRTAKICKKALRSLILRLQR